MQWVIITTLQSTLSQQKLSCIIRRCAKCPLRTAPARSINYKRDLIRFCPGEKLLWDLNPYLMTCVTGKWYISNEEATFACLLFIVGMSHHASNSSFHLRSFIREGSGENTTLSCIPYLVLDIIYNYNTKKCILTISSTTQSKQTSNNMLMLISGYLFSYIKRTNPTNLAFVPLFFLLFFFAGQQSPRKTKHGK